MIIDVPSTTSVDVTATDTNATTYDASIRVVVAKKVMVRVTVLRIMIGGGCRCGWITVGELGLVAVGDGWIK